MGPIYCDLRGIQGDRVIQDIIVETIAQKFREHSVEYVAGIKTGAIPTSVLVARELQAAHLSVNKSVKEVTGNVVEGLNGRFLHGRRVLVIEDTVNKGGSLRHGIDAIQTLDAEMLAACILAYRVDTDVGAPLFALTTLQYVFDALRATEGSNQGVVDALFQWHYDPVSWTPKRPQLL